MIFEHGSSQQMYSPITLCVLGFCSLMIFHKSMDLMLMNNYVNEEYSKLSYQKRTLNHEKKSLEVDLDKVYVYEGDGHDTNLEPSNVKKIELINKLKDWSDT